MQPSNTQTEYFWRGKTLDGEDNENRKGSGRITLISILGLKL
jgi:hypothetical protein